MMTSYHPFTNKPQIVLRRYLIGQCSSEREHPVYEKDNSGFYKELCTEVKKYFDTTGTTHLCFVSSVLYTYIVSLTNYRQACTTRIRFRVLGV